PAAKVRPAVAMIMPDDSEPNWIYQHDALRGAQQRARELGWDLLVEHWNPQVRHFLGRDHLVGAILAMRPDADRLSEIPAWVPLCLIHHEGDDPRYDVVNADEAQGIAAAVAHLVEMGHRRIGYLGYVPPARVRRGYQHDVRPQAFRAACAAQGLTLRDNDCQFQQTEMLPSETFVTIAERLATWMATDDPPSALLCYHDGLAGQVHGAALQLGVRIPHDLSLMAVSAVGLAPHLVPALSTIEQDNEGIGRAAVNCLHDRPHGAARRGPYRVTCQSAVIQRGSVLRFS
ncbi:MAG: substrate-binding domain-containing protein, partial [Planctomycetota bacterium]|nr:substrate-binding domain-containing protein [Planctomycetota bacterium]